MQNVYRTVANNLWIAETHCICEWSTYHLVFRRPSAVGYQAAVLQHCLGLHEPAYLIGYVGWSFYRKQVVICATYSVIYWPIVGRCSCWARPC